MALVPVVLKEPFLSPRNWSLYFEQYIKGQSEYLHKVNQTSTWKTNKGCVCCMLTLKAASRIFLLNPDNNDGWFWVPDNKKDC